MRRTTAVCPDTVDNSKTLPSSTNLICRDRQYEYSVPDFVSGRDLSLKTVSRNSEHESFGTLNAQTSSE